MTNYPSHLPCTPVESGTQVPFFPTTPAEPGTSAQFQPLPKLDLSEALQDQSRSEAFAKWKERIKIAIPHLGLVLLSCLYTLLGGVMFHFIEAPNEVRVKADALSEIYAFKKDLSQELWLMSKNGSASQDDFSEVTSEKLDELMIMLLRRKRKNVLTVQDIVQKNESEIRWNFPAALFFSATVITTIGYGHLVPQTLTGQIVCVFYGMFGIPLVLVTVADLGKFLAELLIRINRVYKKCRRWISTTVTRIRRRKHHPIRSCSDHFKNEVPLRRKNSRQSGVTFAESEVKSDSLNLPELVERPQEPEISVLFVLGLLVGYMALGAFCFHLWENWTFFESFYYCFITVTTIGFGDLVPQRDAFLSINLIFIAAGLVITTMCIDLVGSQYIQRIHYFGRNIAMARNALAMVGDRVFQFGDVLRCAAILQKRYGLRPEEIERLARYSDAFLMDCLLSGKPLPPYFRALLLSLRPFIPRDIAYIRYIDKRYSNSFHGSERLFASLESLDVTSRCSTARTAREWYLWWDREYNVRL